MKEALGTFCGRTLLISTETSDRNQFSRPENYFTEPLVIFVTPVH